MKKLLINNLWEYEIIKNIGAGLKGYGYTLIIYKDNNIIYNQSGYGSISIAQASARDIFLSYEFNIDREEE